MKFVPTNVSFFRWRDPRGLRVAVKIKDYVCAREKIQCLLTPLLTRILIFYIGSSTTVYLNFNFQFYFNFITWKKTNYIKYDVKLLVALIPKIPKLKSCARWSLYSWVRESFGFLFFISFAIKGLYSYTYAY